MNYPLKFLVRGEIPALKNARVPIPGQYGTRPNKEVENAIKRFKEAYERQLPEDFEVIKEPTEVFVMAEIGVFYKSDLPKSDLDNAATTLLESLFTAKTLEGPVLQDDRQVASFWPLRRKMVNSKELTFTKIWIWPAEHAHEMFENVLLSLDHTYGNLVLDKS